MSAYEKIRAALDLAASIHDDRMPYAEEMRRDELVESALAALAELERAAQTPAPVAEIREAVITDEVARKVFNAWIDARWRLNEGQDAKYGHAMINVVRAELGPALGLVEIREPTPEECERIDREWKRLIDYTSENNSGRAMFRAVRAVMWPKSEGQS